MPCTQALTQPNKRSEIMQAQLFQGSQSTTEDIDLGEGQLRLILEAFEFRKSEGWLATLLSEISWQQDTLWIAGREVLVPRLQCWMGDLGSNYGYSGIRLEPEPWNDLVLEIKADVEERSGQAFNSVLLNLYRDGRDSVSWHADDERELGADPVIASVSLGETRRFDLKHKTDKSRERLRLDLPHGSLLIMGKGIQNNWLHQIPKSNYVSSPRINLTFRQIQND